MFGVQVVEVLEFAVVGDPDQTKTKHAFKTHKPLTAEIIAKESPEAAVHSCVRKSVKAKQVKQPPGVVTGNEQTLRIKPETRLPHKLPKRRK
jgi:hypothetical protein